MKHQDVSRFISQGRNFHIAYVGITQKLGSVDANLVEISGVKSWFKSEGENSIRKARAWLDKFHVFRLRDLERGQCYLQIGSKAKFLRLPQFQNL